MAQSEESSSQPLPIAGLVSLVLAALAVVIPPLIPLDSSRPFGNNAKFLFQSIEDVDARLWQDPFAVTEQHKSDGEQDVPEMSCRDREENPTLSHHNTSAFACSIKSHASNNSDAKPLIISVMVPGGPYAENAEQRMRIRYAILSGLAVNDYAPEDSEHIGYFNTPPSNRLPYLIPFEWFMKVEKNDKKKPKERRSVLVLWLDATAFNHEPIKRAEELKDYIDKAIEHVHIDEDHQQFRFQSKYLFVGPNTSGMLQTMTKEASSFKNKPENQFNSSANDIEFYNVDATADDYVLNAASEKYHSKLLDDQTYPKLLRTTLTDYQLAQKLTEELKLRGIDPSCRNSDIRTCNQFSKDNIVLVSEWDTFYGRLGLPTAIMRAMVCNAGNCDPLGAKWLAPNWIHQFSYMRGLDGVVPDDSDNEKSHDRKTNKTPDKEKTLKSTAERPEGQSQKDYLRRMAERIEKLNKELENNNQSSQIRAIGVLGSDAYDKLLVLKALRPKFPNVVFFTTDLDSRLMHPEDVDATRNLVVVSSFGLQLRHELQKNIPPFRDSRQTAYFFATQIALRNKEFGAEEAFNQATINKLLKPRVFELGLHSPVDLSPSENNDCDSTSTACCKTFDTCQTIYPRPEKAWREWKPALFGLFFMAIAMTSFKRFRETFKQVWKNLSPFKQSSLAQPEKSKEGSAEIRVWVYLARIIVALALIAIVFTGAEIILTEHGEPFTWVNGVSIWPSEIVRLLAGMVGAFFIAKSVNDLQKHKEDIEKTFLLSNFANVTIESKSENRVSIDKVWREYCSNIQYNNFSKWVLTATAILWLLLACLSYAFGSPYTPFRGYVSSIANLLTLVFVVSVLLLLLTMALNTTRICATLIDNIIPNASIWPLNTLKKFGVISSVRLDQLYLRLKRQGIEYQLQEWLDIELIAELTHSVRNVAYYPFTVLTLLGISRSKIFDNWDFPIGLFLVYIVCGSLILGSNLYLRHKTEEARRKVLKQLDSMKLALGNFKEEEADTLRKNISQAIERIKAFNHGAYMPLRQDPVIQAILLPLGGWGGITLLQYLSMFGIA
ncbi:MAG: hypothetical protein ACU836_01105 [Gammaproteobacteria bacterium]